MTAEKLAEILENHKKWLANDGGCRANLGRANLSFADLSGANLGRADLSFADLSGANLGRADLSGASLIGADLSGANLVRADLSGASLSGANLSRADLSGAKGLLDTVNFMEAHFERVDCGYIVYKTFGGSYEPPDEWKIEPQSIIEETVNFDRCTECGSGINVAPLEWVRENYPNNEIWKCLIEWPWLVGVCVPYSTDGKIRCSRVRLLEVVSDG